MEKMISNLETEYTLVEFLHLRNVYYFKVI